MNLLSTYFYSQIFLAISLVVVIVALLCIARNIWKNNKRPTKVEHRVHRHNGNPIISPLSHSEWETSGTFNPAAVEDPAGHVHLLYRAIGNNGLSNIGHASSPDGILFERRSAFPVYQTAVEINKSSATKPNSPQEYNPTLYTSGGGWGGYEDPRAVKIGSRVYMTYTAFEGWDSVRMAVTSIAADDLKNEKWNWKKPRFISPPKEVHKNWVLFPEKINGKFAILHSIAPNILVDYLDDIDNSHSNQYIKSRAPRGGREEHWDNWMRGVGAPPIKTDIGWLVLYHAMDKKDPNKYKLGAMILEKNNPTKILYRAPEPILSPEMCYENDGKPGVVYASGALVKNGELRIYYGGGDRHVCVAQTPLQPLLSWLMTYGKTV